MQRLTERDLAISRRVTRARLDAGLSQKEVGQRLGLTKAGYGHYERGRQAFAVKQLFALSDILGRSVEWFLDLPADLDETERELLGAWRVTESEPVRACVLNVAKAAVALGGHCSRVEACSPK